MRLHLVSLALVIVAAIHGRARACTCVETDERQRIESADAVFMGRVVSIRRTSRYERAFLRIDEAVKGTQLGQEIVIWYGLGLTSCDPRPLQIGHSYDVFARRGPNGRLTIGLCSGTRDVTHGIMRLEPGCGRCDAGAPASGELAILAAVGGLLCRRRRCERRASPRSK